MSQIRESLYLYYIDHTSYPPLSPGQSSLLISETLHCLSEEGFLPLSNQACEKKDYLLRFKGHFASYHLFPSFLYTPENADGTPCTSQQGCDAYAVPFELKTNAVYPRGSHTLMPAGIY